MNVGSFETIGTVSLTVISVLVNYRIQYYIGNACTRVYQVMKLHKHTYVCCVLFNVLHDCFFFFSF